MGFGITDVLQLIGVLRLLGTLGLVIWAATAVRGRARMPATVGALLLLLAPMASFATASLVARAGLGAAVIMQALTTVLDLLGIALLIVAASRASRAVVPGAVAGPYRPGPGAPGRPPASAQPGPWAPADQPGRPSQPQEQPTVQQPWREVPPMGQSSAPQSWQGGTPQPGQPHPGQSQPGESQGSADGQGPRW